MLVTCIKINKRMWGQSDSQKGEKCSMGVPPASLDL